MKLTKENLERIIEEEVQKLLHEENVSTSDGIVKFMEKENGNYVLQIRTRGPSLSTKMNQSQAERLHDLIMNKV